MALKFRLVKRTVRLGKDAGKSLHYANAVSNGKVTFRRFCEELSDGSTVDKADIMAVLQRMTTVLRRHMEDGRSVEIDDFGTFSPTFGSDSVLKAEDFNARTHIRDPKISFRPKLSFKTLNGVSFERISEEEAAARDAVTAKKRRKKKAKVMAAVQAVTVVVRDYRQRSQTF